MRQRILCQNLPVIKRDVEGIRGLMFIIIRHGHYRPFGLLVCLPNH